MVFVPSLISPNHDSLPLIPVNITYYPISYCQRTFILEIRNGVSQGFGRRGRVRGASLIPIS
jgi:hypothetical protein